MNTVFVGDPVDVITGKQYDVALDFRIAWTFPFEWRRYYSSARAGELLALGWGHTHSYDHRLRFSVNGVYYVDPAGEAHEFAYPKADGQATVSANGTIRRVNERTFRVKAAGQPECEFEFFDPASPARLCKVFRGASFHELRYIKDGPWAELRYESEPPVLVDADEQGRVVALHWIDRETGQDRVLWEGRYDNSGNLVSVVDPYRTTQTFVYDAAHRMTGRRDRNGYGFVATYDTIRRCDYSAGEDGVQEVHLRYPAEGATIATRADGGIWQYFYGPEGVTQVVDPYAGVTQRVYAADGRLERELGPEGEVLQQVVDPESGLLRDPFGAASGMTLPLGDPWFEPARSLEVPGDALGWEGYGSSQSRHAIRFPARGSPWLRDLPPSVEGALRVAGSKEGAASPSSPYPGPTFAYSAPAPKKSMRLPKRPGVLHHDAFGTLAAYTLPTGETARWHYDANGNVVRHLDHAGSEWQFEYASWNLPVREIDPLGQAVSYQYDRLERRTRVTDAGGTATEQEFDLKDRLIERRRHAQSYDTLGYDRSRGLVRAATNGHERVALKVGPQRRPVEIAPAGQPPRTCAYDQRGRLLAVSAADGKSVAFAYTDTGNRTLDLQNGRGVERKCSGGQIVSCTVLGRFVSRYVYDPDGDRVTTVDPMGGRHLVQQLDSGVFLRRHANGTEELSQFDWNGRCLAKVRFQRSKPHQNWSRVFRYSPVGALLSAADSARGTASYRYDAAHRLVGAMEFDGSRHTFAHDVAGNLVQGPGLEGTSFAENRILGANGRRFEYDCRQNLVRELGSGLDRQYAYDAEDRLVSCRAGGAEVSFRYDALGRRIAKVAPGGTTHFVWDGERLAAEISPANALRVYVYPDGMGLTPFAFIDYDNVESPPGSGRRYYVYSNQIACPVRVENDAGFAVWQADIDAYGRTIIRPNSEIEFNLRWPGHYLDTETGLHYNRFRYYSPELGRYIQVDPRDIEGGINVYTYPSRPLDTVDVDGLAPCPKKAMVQPNEDDPAFQRAKRRADEIAEDMRAAVAREIKRRRSRGEDARDLENTTCAAMVVQRKNGQYKVVVTANRNPDGLPTSVHNAADGARWVGHGDDRPPPVRQSDESHRYPRTRPNGTEDASTHQHAEQRGLRAVDCDNDAQGVAYVAPTRPCCPGCTSAITTPHNSSDPASSTQGGWGGNGDNVSDFGRENW